MPDGSVILVEIAEGQITRVHADGSKTVIAKPGGGPNGLAIGPDGKLYCCNNGGFEYMEANGFLAPHGIAQDYSGGRIERIDIDTGEVEILYKSGDHGCSLRGPNDIVFDAHGGMWFTDHGIRHGRHADLSGIYYAKIDGSMIKEVVFPTDSPNGIGLSPDGNTLYWAETHTGRVFHLAITAPGETAPFSAIDPSVCLCGLPGVQLFDSLAIDGDGNVCVATLGLQTAGITVISPKGEVLEQILTGDPLTTNICFGGPDFKTAYITLSGTGRLVSMPWPYKGLKLNY
jgi:gluconolactonase